MFKKNTKKYGLRKFNITVKKSFGVLEYQKDMDNVMKILKKGTEEARSVAKENLAKFKKALRIDYFD